MEIEIPSTLKRLSDAAATPLYITGGHIRNCICRFKRSDIDICGPAPAAALGLGDKFEVRMVNYRLGTATIKSGADIYEYTPFRTEKYNQGGAHTPSAVSFTTDIRADVKRRDFACNSLYYDIKKGQLIDLVGGRRDAENGILRAVDPKETFSSDGLRLLRLARIAAETGFRIEAATAEAAQKFCGQLRDISPERKRDELNKILLADYKYGKENAHYRGLKLIHKLDLLKNVIPFLSEGEQIPQNPQYHKYNVLEHTFQTVRFADPSVRLAALMHDIGKITAFQKFQNMHGHERISADLCTKLLGERGLKFSNNTVEETAKLCLYHMYDADGKTSEGKLRMFIIENNPIIDKLVLLSNADKLGSGLRQPDPEPRLLAVRKKMQDEGAPFSVAELNIKGDELMALGFEGKAIGDVLDDMLCKCVTEPHLNNSEWLTAHAIRFLERTKTK